jgi:hypothetical protein
MRKPKIQPLPPFVLTCLEILHPLHLTHALPYLLFLLVPPDVIPLGKQEHKNRQDVDGQQLGVAVAVVRLVVVEVDEAVADVAYLDGYLWTVLVTVRKRWGVGRRTL